MDKKLILTAVIALIAGLGIGTTVPLKSLVVSNHSTETDKGTMNMDHSMSMQGTMDSMNKSLEGKTGVAFDQAFLREMTVHHQGAVSMAKMVLKTSKRPELIKLAQDIIAAQEKEIQQMQTWQQQWRDSSTQSN